MSAPAGFSAIPLADPFEIHVGPAYHAGERGERRFAFRVDERHVNRRGVLHGGMMLTFADLAFGAAAADWSSGVPSVTLGMQTQFLKPAHTGDTVEVAPRLTHRTRSLLFISGDFTVGGDLVFCAATVWKLLGEE